MIWQIGRVTGRLMIHDARALSERDAFDAGVRATFDPQPVVDSGTAGVLITRITSYWHTRWCSTCGHTFRRGDKVRMVEGTSAVQHLDPALNCAVTAGSGESSVDVQELLAGLDAAWPVAGDVPVVSTNDAPFLLVGPQAGFRRKICLVCGHSLRRDELVIICPCLPDARRCKGAVHRDPGQGLVCWEIWRPRSTVEVCPILLERLAG